MHATGATSGPSPSSTAGMLAPFVGELDKIAPSFRISGEQIRVLQSPAEFYETIKVALVSSSPTRDTRALSDCRATDQDSQCGTAHLPVDPLHWQDREGIGSCLSALCLGLPASS